ncbi:MAG: tetratricopeptide repeat protein [Bacteroidetes bacterium]|nr:MAG: tetratricopeptide repeat protein [Bacteroidota bacterium]
MGFARSFLRIGVLLVFSLQLSLVLSQSKQQEKRLIRVYEQEENPEKRFWKLYQLANYYQKNNLEKADSIRTSLIALSYSVDDSAKFVSRLFDADMDLAVGDRESYYMKTLELQPFINLLPHPKVKIDIYQRLGVYHIFHRSPEQADIYLKEALRISRKKRLRAEIGKTYQLLSQRYLIENNKDSANYFALEAVQYARRSGDMGIRADAVYNQATIHAYFGQDELCVSKNMLALRWASSSGDHIRQAKFSLNIGESQLAIKNYRDAELYFVTAAEQAAKVNDKRTYALAQINLGLIKLHREDYKTALKHYRKALKMIHANDHDGLGFAYNSIGDLYRQQKDFSKALSNYNKALVSFESAGNREKSAVVYHNVGYVFEQQGKYRNALNYLNRSVEIRSQFGFKGSVYPTYRTISDVYYKLGNTSMAYKYLRMFTDYSDSAKANDASAKIAEFSAMYRTEQYEKDRIVQEDSINRLNQEKELQSTRNENLELKTNLQTYVILGFVVFMLLAGVIGFYRWNQTKIKQQQQQAEMNQTLLRAQMNPHFVFNAMSVIQSYIYDNDTKNSAQFLINFSKLMRLILENSSKESIPIQTEYDILEKYLNIQKLRFEERFEFSIEVDEQLYEEDCVIPPMITQPFIENAIEHGRLHLIEDGFINIHFFKQENMLHITVEDNGIGRKGAELNKKSKEHKSMAMKITRDRIDNLNKKYRSDGFLLIEDFNKIEETGTKVLISIPYRVKNQI